MENKKCKIGFAVCGSFCTFTKAVETVKNLYDAGYEIYPIMSEYSYSTDTRFGAAADFIAQLEEITGKKVIHTIEAAEPIGPKNLIEALVIAPCTGNTLSKLANGITDTSVTMAAKATLRNKRPVIIAISSNDALSGSASNIGKLMNSKNIYFVPFRQDDSQGKPTSLVAEFLMLEKSIEGALDGRQLQPLLID